MKSKNKSFLHLFRRNFKKFKTRFKKLTLISHLHFLNLAFNVFKLRLKRYSASNVINHLCTKIKPVNLEINGIGVQNLRVNTKHKHVFVILTACTVYDSALHTTFDSKFGHITEIARLEGRI